VAREEVLVVWNEGTSTEYFFLRSEYDQRQTVGILVPTPSAPKVETFVSPIFESIRGLALPLPVEVEKVTSETYWSVWDLKRAWRDSFPELPEPGKASKKKIPLVEATPLPPSDSLAAGRWANGHGFRLRPEVEAWMAPYLALGWHLTAIDVDRHPDETRKRPLKTPVVRMSFQTTTPVFPYSEPSDVVSRDRRLLRLFLVTSGRAAATIRGARGWKSRVRYARPISDANLFLGAMPKEALPKDAWLTVIDAPGERQPGLLLDILPARKATEIAPKPAEEIKPVLLPPFGPPVVLAILFLAANRWRKWRTKRAAAPASDSNRADQSTGTKA
jgi:hypothetical protein